MVGLSDYTFDAGENIFITQLTKKFQNIIIVENKEIKLFIRSFQIIKIISKLLNMKNALSRKLVNNERFVKSQIPEVPGGVSITRRSSSPQVTSGQDKFS